MDPIGRRGARTASPPIAFPRIPIPCESSASPPRALTVLKGAGGGRRKRQAAFSRHLSSGYAVVFVLMLPWQVSLTTVRTPAAPTSTRRLSEAEFRGKAHNATRLARYCPCRD